MKDKEKELKRAAEEADAEDMAEDTETVSDMDAENAPDEEERACDPEEAAESSPEEDADSTAAEEEGSSEEAEEAGNSKPDKKDLRIQELNDRYVRLFAEFDNFRKRTEAEKAGMFTEGEKTVLLKILPLIDNFERALQNVPEDEKDSPFTDGIEKVYRSFMDQMKALGVTAIEAVGSEFDANLHNAVMHVEDEEAGENEVVEEFQKGYMFRDKVLRYSMVKVAN
ncbi:MAG: nucleotide exchange factor GrpE [Lachnospiraceae bacterium]|nr:nucleotide exchange factor GrpE [Lachnospiraceae bacterium]MBR2531230.1 nucleotide exchange factor GrpE [Lachnospiraceae bacterium]